MQPLSAPCKPLPKSRCGWPDPALAHTVALGLSQQRPWHAQHFSPCPREEKGLHGVGNAADVPPHQGKGGDGGVPAVPCPTLMPKVPCAKVHLGRFPAPNLTINQINGIFLRGGQVWVSQGTAMGVCAAQCAQSHIPTAGHTHGPWPRGNVCTLKVPPNPSKPHSSAAPALVRKE